MLKTFEREEPKWIICGIRPKLYGDSLNVRDWIHVDDHSSAVWQVLVSGRIDEAYLVGADGEQPNLDVMRAILAEMTLNPDEFDHVRDRPGHDRRYAIDATKIRNELGRHPSFVGFAAGLRDTIDWYRRNESWWRPEKNDVEARYAESGQ